jgi:hypothetical protein
MKFRFTAYLAGPVPVSERYPLGFALCSFLDAVATSEEEARSLIEAYLAEGKAEGRGLFIHHFWPPSQVSDDHPVGVVSDDDESHDLPSEEPATMNITAQHIDEAADYLMRCSALHGTNGMLFENFVEGDAWYDQGPLAVSFGLDPYFDTHPNAVFSYLGFIYFVAANRAWRAGLGRLEQRDGLVYFVLTDEGRIKYPSRSDTTGDEEWEPYQSPGYPEEAPVTKVPPLPPWWLYPVVLFRMLYRRWRGKP